MEYLILLKSFKLYVIAVLISLHYDCIYRKLKKKNPQANFRGKNTYMRNIRFTKLVILTIENIKLIRDKIF